MPAARKTVPRARSPRSNLSAARFAGLLYASDEKPGIRRVRAGKGFVFIGLTGRKLKGAARLKRIRALAIPPAWNDVWICTSVRGHIQATGRDARGRKQYIYHQLWRETRDESKFHRMIAFGRALSRIRRRVRRDLRSRGLAREKVLASVVRLLDLSAIRIGNDEYADQNDSYGLTTLKGHHAKVKGSTIHLRFRGKSGRRHSITIEDPALARIVKKCQDLPGQELFEWLDDDGRVHDVTSGDVNAYLAEISGADFTSKDFRTWTATVLAARALWQADEADSQRDIRTRISQAMKVVASQLGNTPAVCRKSYVHPALVEAYRAGELMMPPVGNGGATSRRSRRGLRLEELAVLKFLQQRARR